MRVPRGYPAMLIFSVNASPWHVPGSCIIDGNDGKNVLKDFWDGTQVYAVLMQVQVMTVCVCTLIGVHTSCTECIVRKQS